MADNAAVEMKPTLGLTGLTMNAMALIAPGAFLWLTFFIQATTGATGAVDVDRHRVRPAALPGDRGLLRGNGQALPRNGQFVLLRRTVVSESRNGVAVCAAFEVHRRLGSHLYYWIYPGVMVGVMGILCGYLVGTLWPNFMSASNPGPMFMMVVAIVFSFGVAYIAHRGVNGSTSVNIAINVIQITALLVFSVMALGYRMNHPPGSVAFQFDSTSGEALHYEFATTKTTADGNRRTHRARRGRNAQAEARCRRQAGAVPSSPIPTKTTTAIS